MAKKNSMPFSQDRGNDTVIVHEPSIAAKPLRPISLSFATAVERLVEPRIRSLRNAASGGGQGLVRREA